MKKVFCIGELLIDFVAEKQGSDLSKAHDFTKKAGGAPANVACAIAKLGGRSYFIGAVGEDPFGSFLLNILEAHQVDISLAQRSEEFTTLAFVSLAENGERDFVFSRGADKSLKYDPKIKNQFSGNLVHFGAATALLGGPLEEAYNRYRFDALTQNAFISFDPNFRGDLWKNRKDQFVKKAQPFIEKSHLCKFSLEEAQLLAGKSDTKTACAEIHKMGATLIAVTLGAEGTFISTPDTQFGVPSIAITPVDTTGAGDAFIGCLLSQIANLTSPFSVVDNQELLKQMVYKANKAGAITATNFGAIKSLPSPEDLQ